MLSVQSNLSSWAWSAALGTEEGFMLRSQLHVLAAWVWCSPSCSPSSLRTAGDMLACGPWGGLVSPRPSPRPQIALVRLVGLPGHWMGPVGSSVFGEGAFHVGIGSSRSMASSEPGRSYTVIDEYIEEAGYRPR